MEIIRIKKVNSSEDSEGYIAVVSSLILTAIIITVVLVSASSVFFGRAGTFIFKDKKSTRFLAESCLEVALLNLADDKGYSGNETITVGSSSCKIGPITLAAENRIVNSSASSTLSATNLQLTVVSTTLAKVSLEELQQF